MGLAVPSGLFHLTHPVPASAAGRPEQGRPEPGLLTPFQGPVALGDIPFYFSREEWGTLDPAQRDLFWGIKRENSRNTTLGKHPGPLGPGWPPPILLELQSCFPPHP